MIRCYKDELCIMDGISLEELDKLIIQEAGNPPEEWEDI